jgi:5'-3' exonuclease
MIDGMGSPFRYRKKERKRLRRHAKKELMAAEKFEAEGVKPKAAEVSRWLAEFNIRMSRAKRGKKTKSKNPN